MTIRRRSYSCSVLILAALAVTASAVRAQFSKATILLSGTVRCAETGEPLRASLAFLDASGAEVNSAKTNAAGVYEAVLKPGLHYDIRITASHYYIADESLQMPGDGSYHEMSHDFNLRQINAGAALFDGDCFDRGSVALMPNAAAEIASIGKTMKRNDEIVVNIETFSDEAADGAAVPPADEGTLRADAIRNVLLANGASKDRITENPHNPPPESQPERVSKKHKHSRKKKTSQKWQIKRWRDSKGKWHRTRVRAVKNAAPAKAILTIAKVLSDDD